MLITGDSYTFADQSASLILGIDRKYKQLSFNSPPSRKGRKRFGISSLPTHPSILDSSKSPVSESMWVQSLLEKRIKYDLTQAINAFINGVQSLLVKIDNESIESSYGLRQREAVSHTIQGKTWEEKRLKYINTFLNAYDA